MSRKVYLLGASWKRGTSEVPHGESFSCNFIGDSLLKRCSELSPFDIFKTLDSLILRNHHGINDFHGCKFKFSGTDNPFANSSSM